MRDELRWERSRVDLIKKENNDLQQYSRRNNVRIFGLDDRNANETSNQTERLVGQLISDKLGVPILPSDIEDAHRTGRFSKGANQPVIVRFFSRKTKAVILFNRRKQRHT